MRVVFFDAVGTVLFPAVPAAQVYANAARSHGLPADPAAIGPRLWAHFHVEEAADRVRHWQTSESREQQRWRNIVFTAIDGATDDLFQELFSHFAKPTSWVVPPAAAECIARLHARGVALGMGSNYDSRLASVVDGTPALHPLRDRLVISSLVGVRKPGRVFFDAVTRAAGCDPVDITFVGDDPENAYDGANAAGMRAVLLDEKGMYEQVANRVRSLGEVS